MKFNKVIMALTLLSSINTLFVITGISSHQEAVANESPTKQTDAFPDYAIGLFSHKAHVTSAGLQCTDCHNKIFEMSASRAKASGDFNKISFREGKYCGACHNGTGAFSIQDEAKCKRCHGNDVNPPNTILLKKTVKVLFDHALHNKELGLACNECHMKLFDMKTGSTGEQADFTMEAMYDGKYCGACHNGTLAFDLKADCTKCHVDTPEYKEAISGAGKKEEAEQ
ncbi:c(7)-type cytochrome triheme domain-containing protein [Candidatus Electrothrix sp.]|uniref:c(7)-type cytochrome triheme domain-containing protein n=1 Tax=Candidatus Electrothrix sp. TaxID=2170559 RepID=UPI004057816C